MARAAGGWGPFGGVVVAKRRRQIATDDMGSAGLKYDRAPAGVILRCGPALATQEKSVCTRVGTEHAPRNLDVVTARVGVLEADQGIGTDSTISSGSYANVSGGRHNVASGLYTFVGGGGGEDPSDGNEAFSSYSATTGGVANVAGDDSDPDDHSAGLHATVCGGLINRASGDYASISGGSYNAASGPYSSVSGGWFNTASGEYASVSGGFENTASGGASSISGGFDNTTSGGYSSISGGSRNISNDSYSSVSGGRGNTASGRFASVSGGQDNTASGEYSSVSGGNGVAVSGYHDWGAGSLFEDQ